jgi:type IV pilus assembly protein PilO
MLKNFKNLRLPQNVTKDPRVIARAVLGILLFANLLAAFAIFRPLGGSAEELDRQLADLQNQLQREQGLLQRMRSMETKIATARESGDAFLQSYFMSRRTASSTIVEELHKAGKESGMRPREHSFTIDPLEGSDTLNMMTVVANYEGTYGDLLQFVNRLDKSNRFLIIDTMSAAPLQGSPNLAISIKLNTFVREDGPTA